MESQASPDAYAQWKQLRAKWQEANQKAREARYATTRAFAECRAGRGAGPTDAELDNADALERHADSLGVEMDQFVIKTLG